MNAPKKVIGEDKVQAAFRHALCQPLFAIMLAAENGALMLAHGDPTHRERAAAKFALIVDQVERMQAMLGVGGVPVNADAPEHEAPGRSV